MKNFLVYKSSAGSGKTTTLVNEYLKITLKAPTAFRQVLAITFTNKAANELKTRILEILEDLVSGQLDKKMLSFLCSETGLSTEEIRLRADRLLTLILHHYDEFAVSTIDSFVHQLVRAFATDLKLPQGFEVLIDEDDLIPFILESLYQQVGSNLSLTEILTRFVLSQIDDDKSYDPTANLTRFIKKQLKEEGFSEVKKMASISMQDFTEIISGLHNAINELKKKMQTEAEKALDLITVHGLNVTDFQQTTKGPVGYFQKIKDGSAIDNIESLRPNSYVKKALEEDIWYKASTSVGVKSSIDAIAPELKNYLLNLTDWAEAYTKRKLIYENIYELALIREIQIIFKAFTDQTQKVHISEFNKRIHEEIADQPVPFIYERVGNRYRHFLIDEFQDTSVLQWKNLLPLLEESLANGNFNMVVGDAKQAIYRFRSGEMELFARLPELFPPAQNSDELQRQSVLEAHYNEQQLKINYRSREEIVLFNNRFFGAGSKQIGSEFSSIYDGHDQDLPVNKKNGGWVSVEFLEYLKKEEIENNRLTAIETKIKALSESGYPLRDICVLTRSNNTGLEIAAHLLSKGYPVLSSESLKLMASPLIRLLVAYLQLISNGKDELALTEFLAAYVLYFGRNDELTGLFVEARTEKDYLSWIRKTLALDLPERSKLLQYSVFEMTLEGVHYLTNLVHNDLFVQFFLDFVEGNKSNYQSLEEFLDLWEDKKHAQSIVIPEGQNAVQVMTAHKSKGLKFGVVIADLYQYDNKLTQDQLWETVNFPEVEKLDRALLKVSKKLDLIGLGEVYERESTKSKLDFLNLIYVAFTRPVDGLYVIAHWRESKPDQFSKLIKIAFENLGIWEEGKLLYNFGALEAPVSKEQKETTEIQPEEHEFDTGLWYEHMVLAPVDEVYWEVLGKKSPRVYGNLIHEMLSKIRYAEEKEHVVNDYLYSGVIDKSEAEHLKKLLEKVLVHRHVKPYFIRGNMVKTETELIDKINGIVLRPDRVVITDQKLVLIDYKTGERKEEHVSQMNQYASFFLGMGYHDVVKQLVYINKVVEVDVF
ncbi:MAG: UvrD-helicase domain-containing protein [Bacteroidales bacterium]|nr:UvrD-helicase domain-containing protein [Bacteroidales bacterium]